ncbi:hypothetical protein LUZ61_003548 [Rhynchospora tenuis]|uniref:Uncharacterized protein n=1 Tax=Rhynchospora tenuis TaxID=198213 RepID=A0AAD5ZL37_9POAL|nr:hypothetical protein LUZ61_003548 [Rhynchospora tenuis]
MNGGQRSTASATGTNFNSYNFDFGLPNTRSGSSQPLRGNHAPSPASPSPTPSWSYQPAPRPAARPSWTHQPAPKPTSNPSAGASSMVGDIFGKTWSSSTASNTSSIGIPQNNPNLFGDLFASALGSGSGQGSNAPLKSMGSSQKGSFSMNNLSDSLPKSTDSGMNFASFGQPKGSIPNSMGSTSQPIRSATGSFGSAPAMGQKKDPFDSLSGFGSTAKPAMKSTPAPAPAPAPANSAKPDLFGSTNPSHFDAFPAPPQAQTFSSSTTTANKSSPLPNDDMDMFFASKTTSNPPAPTNEMNDWDIGSDFAAADAGGTTTELEGLPPPPAGLSGASCKTKGMDNYKQGQYADAIKWLSWAVIILEKQGDSDALTEVLTSRASSYKEVGEYKKAIADCSKVLENDKENVSVLIQRALLYESNEKYRLGAEDLRMVLKIDPTNRLARSTIHRLQKMAD